MRGHIINDVIEFMRSISFSCDFAEDIPTIVAQYVQKSVHSASVWHSKYHMFVSHLAAELEQSF